MPNPGLAVAAAFVVIAIAGCVPGSGSTPAGDQLEQLAVIARPGDNHTYRRSAFGKAWADVDQNACNQRDDALLTHLDHGRPYTIRRQGRCNHDVIAGTWTDPYTGLQVSFTDLKDPHQAEQLPIDHVLALAVAWRYGASSWTAAQRLTFANDLDNLQPTTRASNDAKGGADAATWQPPEPAQCAYATTYVTIKARYQLPVDTVEKQTLRTMLRNCSD